MQRDQVAGWRLCYPVQQAWRSSYPLELDTSRTPTFRPMTGVQLAVDMFLPGKVGSQAVLGDNDAKSSYKME